MPDEGRCGDGHDAAEHRFEEMRGMGVGRGQRGRELDRGEHAFGVGGCAARAEALAHEERRRVFGDQPLEPREAALIGAEPSQRRVGHVRVVSLVGRAGGGIDIRRETGGGHAIPPSGFVGASAVPRTDKWPLRAAVCRPFIVAFEYRSSSAVNSASIACWGLSRAVPDECIRPASHRAERNAPFV